MYKNKAADGLNNICSGKELDIPETVQGHVVTRAAPFAFSRQRQITAVSIPDTVDSIGQEAFYICPSL